MDAKAVALLRKLVALFDSPNEGERENAFAKAKRLLEQHHENLALLEALEAAHQHCQPKDFDYETIAGRPDRPVPRRDPPPAPRGATPNSEAYTAIVARHGSLAKALRPCKRETALRSAVQSASVFFAPPNERWTKTVYGYDGENPDGRDKAEQAIARATPLPGTLPEALAEIAHWDEREREFRILLGDGSKLDLTARIRRDELRDLVRTGLHARNLEEFQMRLDFWLKERRQEMDAVVVSDLERVAQDVGGNLHQAIARTGRPAAELFSKWICDVVIPALPAGEASPSYRPRTFDEMLTEAIRATEQAG